MVANEHQLPSKCRIVAEEVVSGGLAFDLGDTSDDHDPCLPHHMKPIMEAFAVMTTATKALLRSVVRSFHEHLMTWPNLRIDI
jgi:hypothetical protein